jgi:(E)-4-hydroxy-3-methylbut-2-enyl-diphosphate synthase
MYSRIETKRIKIGNIYIGGQNKVLIQSMCNIKTSKVQEVAAQINRCAALGADMMRISILDYDDAYSIGEIKALTKIPLIADIHFNYNFALIAMEQGIDAIRINPGNIGNEARIKTVVEYATKYNVPIRVGVNSGSIDSSLITNQKDERVRAELLVESARKHVNILENLGFKNIVVSLKGSNVIETIHAYRLASKIFPYPLHLGITEAGPSEIGIIRSVAGLAPLLVDRIGDTIRISLSDEPEEEIKVAKRLLHDIGLYPNYPTLISCPTCGRTQVDVVTLANKVLKYLEDNNIQKTVAIMGCIVNGPGEASHADIGLAGGADCWVLFKHGRMLRKINAEDAYDTLVDEINKMRMPKTTKDKL